ncbi:response regulator [Rhizobium sp. P28RR-XV]|uniref:response regulator n=1 Tax=Rhizobium sp. P28RR-XV TaxID=2726737 RepID=UPI0014573CE9|nr:response regulator [Rhizobium sp. P28RR-XV]NLR86227.1 response regulator [Rhizobium sp. P28RR-XV]
MTDNNAVLIVEDEYFIAADLADVLRQEGYDIVGPAPSVDRALELMESVRPIAAVLDIQLNEEQSYPIADKLAASKIPFLFLTCFTVEDLPPRFSDRPLLSKLSDFAAVAVALSKLT